MGRRKNSLELLDRIFDAYDAGDYHAVIKMTTEALNDPDFVPESAYYLRGMAYGELGELQKAVDELKEKVEN